jgi:hypothetical protein
MTHRKGPWITRTPAGHLVQWERGNYRYTLGYRFSRTLKRFHATRWVLAMRPFSAHFISYPMTDGERRERGI